MQKRASICLLQVLLVLTAVLLDSSMKLLKLRVRKEKASIIHRLHQHIVLFIALQANKKASQQPSKQ